jgi:hypothetical protein
MRTGEVANDLLARRYLRLEPLHDLRLLRLRSSALEGLLPAAEKLFPPPVQRLLCNPGAAGYLRRWLLFAQ